MTKNAPLRLSRALVNVLLKKKGACDDDQLRLASLHVADALGNGIAAGHETAEVSQLVWIAGLSNGGCSLIGGGKNTGPIEAASTNAALIHSLDFDDIHDLARLHPTTVTLAAAMAAIDLVGGTYKTLLVAVSLGNELMCRLGMMIKPAGAGPGSDWFLTQLFGYFGAAFTAGAVLGLDEDEMVSAMGLASMQAAGSKQAAFGVGATARAIYPAFAAGGGLQAALLAQAGMIGPDASLEGAAGTLPLYLQFKPDECAVNALLDKNPWVWNGTQIKRWPCCRLAHPYMQIAGDIRSQLKGDPPSQILVHVNESTQKLCVPHAARCGPETIQDAKYSIPFMIAVMLVRGQVDLNTMTPDVLHDAEISSLAAQMKILPTLADGPGHCPALIEVHNTQGKKSYRFENRLTASPQFARTKFISALSYAGCDAVDGEAAWIRLTQSNFDQAFKNLSRPWLKDL